MQTKTTSNRFIYVLGALVASFVWADDSDIYINDPGAPPYAVLALDYRPNIFSSTCSDTGHPELDPSKTISCLENLGYVEKEDFTVDPDTGYVDTTNTPVYNFITSWDPAGGAAWSDGLGKLDTSIEPWEQMVAVYAVAIKQLPKDIYLALAISHNDTCTGSGATAGPTVSGCSNGAYIVKGLTLVGPSDTSDVGATGLIDKLKAIPSADTGSVTHLFQGAELYYEISRYLRGQEIYNAHLGWDDYVKTGGGVGTTEYNLNDPLNIAEDGSHTASNYDSSGYIGADPDSSIIQASTLAGSLLDPSADPLTASIPSYKDPYAENSFVDECVKTYVINNFFKESQQESNSNGAIESDVDLGINSLGSDPFLDMVTAFATKPFANGQPVQSIFIAGAQAISAGKVPDYSKAGTPADEGEIGPYSRDNAKEFLEGLQGALTAILSRSATFVSASVPVNVFDRVEVIDNVYLALFQADRDAKPFWPGNVKKLKAVTVQDPDNLDDPDATITIIVDANYTSGNDPIADSAFDTDGRIKRTALTFWTNPDGFDMENNYSAEDLDEHDRDGRSTVRGGAGQNIPGLINGTSRGRPGINNDNSASGVIANKTDGSPAPRQMYTEPTTDFADGYTGDDISGDGLIPLNAGLTLADDADIKAALGVTDKSDAVELLAWFRGLDAVDATGDGSLETFTGGTKDTVSTRDWFLGDVLHSQPLPVNYGCADSSVSDCEQRIRLFFGTNDGVFHMVRNTNNTSGAEMGDEIAGFIPHSLLHLASILTGGPTIPVHPYGMDGKPVALQIDNDNDGNIEPLDGDKVYVYVTMRRGGDELFAFDATNPDVPMKFLWKINSSSSGFSELGMTFSNPAVGVVRTGVQSDTDGGESIDKDVLVFAGGFCGGWNSDYSARVCKDLEGYAATLTEPDSEGNAIYMVDAQSGDLIWKATYGSSTTSIPNTASRDHYQHSAMIHSIPSNVTVFDSNENGIWDRGYVGDTGGNVWRIDIPEARKSGSSAVDGREKWFVSLFAELGIDALDTSASAAEKAVNDRRFFHAPDVVLTYMPDGTKTDKVIITSGDRPHPREEDVQNGVFVLNDLHVISGDSTLLNDDSSAGTVGVPLNNAINKDQLADTADCTSGDTTSDGYAACATAGTDTEGWYLDFDQPGEKGLSQPLTTEGPLLFTTYLPNGEPGSGGTVDICAAPEGSSRLYALNVANGAPTSHISGTLDGDKHTDIGDGMHGDVTPYGSDDVLIPGTGIDGKQVVNVSSRSQLKIYWYEKGLDVP